MNKKVIAITQARYGSTRLPAKVLKKINGQTLLEIHLQRIQQSTKIDELIVATTYEQGAEKIIKIANSIGVQAKQGSTDNVLERFYQVAKPLNPDYVVRITSDCPLVDAKLIDKIIDYTIKKQLDYCSNTLEEKYPEGLDVEVFTFRALEEAYQKATLKSDREHVTPYIWRNSTFKGGELYQSDNFCDINDNLQEIRITVDEPLDFEFIKTVIEGKGTDKDWQEYVAFIQNGVEMINRFIKRNEGYEKSLKEDELYMKKNMNTGQDLYKKAKTVIAGGTMLLSKRPEMFLPEKWPSYYSKAKGIDVWDLDDNKYTDMCIMGIGTNTLGYGHDAVDNAVRGVIDKGNMSTFNCPEEVYLAEELIEMNPWADMVRFARAGGEANAIAIRIARACTGKDKVAICGYHGWHDWYLSTNLGNNEGLAPHLLSGLDPAGVPSGLKGSVLPFLYNDYDEIENLVKNHDIGVIKMEVQRNLPPKEDYLQKIRKLADDNGIVLIFDECTSGFRETYGGIFQKYGVEPDMVVFGKTIANGYALTAVVGKKEVMESAQNTFISSTFWTERIGPTASLKTLEVMKQEQSWAYITEIGEYVKQQWQKIADLHQLEINQFGIPSLAGFAFVSDNALKYKTFITQEMLKKGYLASTLLYSSIKHNKENIDKYMIELETVFAQIKQCENGTLHIDELLETPVCHAGFNRLN